MGVQSHSLLNRMIGTNRSCNSSFTDYADKRRRGIKSLFEKYIVGSALRTCL